MAISEVITLGIGTPSSIPYFLTFGLGNFSLVAPAVVPGVFGYDVPIGRSRGADVAIGRAEGYDTPTGRSRGRSQ